MAPRSRKRRKVSNPPDIKGFKPYGGSNRSPGEMINLLYEEYEALRLCDYDHKTHHEASIIMEVSRPTFTRIYASALQKIAKAFVEGRGVSIEGGHVYFDSDWFLCNVCASKFNNPDKNIPPGECPLCGSKDVVAMKGETYEGHMRLSEKVKVFICDHCKVIKRVNTGQSAGTVSCKICGIPMRVDERQICNGYNSHSS